MINILYIGPLDEGGTCLQRMQALADLGHEVTPLNTNPQDVQKKQQCSLYRVRRKFIGPVDLAGINSQILQYFKKNFYQVLWVDKGLTVNPKILKTVKKESPHTVIVGYSPDDMLNPDNQSHHFLGGLPFYDIYFTTKSYNVKELADIGCPKVVFVDNAYDPKTHRPMDIANVDMSKFGGPIGFVGEYERERAEALFYLAKKGISVRVWGAGWRRCKLSHPNLKLEGRFLLGEEYTKAICSFDINICFLRKINRDLQTTRSIEIPACGAFMLAERTCEHLSLFREDIEAVFFGNYEELLNKVQYYLTHDKERRLIAQAGYERCVSGGYSNKERLCKMIECIRCLKN
ncbi:MAG: glycosyltransferase [Candidatus Omnitrophica bacterium]|nr:glycosyltransferase [Candidatus Omnitrophota bacterium]MBU1127560.1 glycosyltransferase [Candidatus Omnitrophota bacterium]MBU1852396.1 glycosyltransferase [Candidatus Omnitrophota bacterium]